MTHSLKARLLDRLMARRHRAKRACHTKSLARCLCKHAKRSHFEGKASEARREQEHYVQCRRAFLAWSSRHAETLGTTTIIRSTRTSMEVRFGNLNPVLSFSVSGTSIGAFVLVGQFRDWLAEFDSAPRWQSGGYVCDLIMREYAVVYPDRFGLWRGEVFDYFQRWFAADFLTATGLIADYNGSIGFMTTALYPGKHVPSRDGHTCFPLFVNASQTPVEGGTI
ncbi:hypothetical protein [Trinickia mobilis]|uniref:hypothetical protein n=1 Tax=Trinickia mobilis TaxID=2816356 RepID=UPI001A8E3E2C|nr:hypothetical protein [Trinickia mobilis]